MEQPRSHELPRERSFRLVRAVRSGMITVWNLITGKYRLQVLSGASSAWSRPERPLLIDSNAPPLRRFGVHARTPAVGFAGRLVRSKVSVIVLFGQYGGLISKRSTDAL